MGRTNKSVEIRINGKLQYKGMARWIYFRKGISVHNIDLGTVNMIYCRVVGSAKVRKTMYGNSIRINIE